MGDRRREESNYQIYIKKKTYCRYHTIVNLLFLHLVSLAHHPLYLHTELKLRQLDSMVWSNGCSPSIQHCLYPLCKAFHIPFLPGRCCLCLPNSRGMSLQSLPCAPSKALCPRGPGISVFPKPISLTAGSATQNPSMLLWKQCFLQKNWAAVWGQRDCNQEQRRSKTSLPWKSGEGDSLPVSSYTS